MAEVQSDSYDAVFANFVLEHVADLQAGAAEIPRVLRPSGLFACSVPNTAAPKFLLFRVTPAWSHRIVRGKRGHDTAYAYGSVGELEGIFRADVFRRTTIAWFPEVGRYLNGYRVLRSVGKPYDRAVLKTNATYLIGEVFLAFVRL